MTSGFRGHCLARWRFLALDTKLSDRFVSERLAAEWGASRDAIHEVAEAQVLRLSIDEADRGSTGRPAVRGFSIEKHGGYIGPVVRHLAERLPDAVGPFGAYVGVPGPGGLFVRPLAAGLDLRGDLADVALLTHLVHEKAGVRIAGVPFWVRPTGEIERAPLRLDNSGMVLGSHHPGLAGVLAALDPLEFLEVPGWAQGKLTPEQYVRFAGCVSATLGYATPEEVAQLGSALNLAPLAAICGAAPFATWLGVVDEHVRRSQDDAKASTQLAVGGIEDRDATLAGLVTWIQAPVGDPTTMVTRPVGETGFVEVLGVVANGHAQAVRPAFAEGMGEMDELFDHGRAAIRAGLSVTPSKAERLSGSESHVAGLPSPTAAIPHLMTWLPEITGPYGALIAVGNASRLDVLPVYDASVILDLPAMLGSAAGAALTAEWAVPPSVFWLSPGSLEVLHVEMAGGIVTGITSSADVAGIVARLPMGPRRLPPGLEAILGPEGSVRFYGLLHAAVVERLGTDPAGLAELWIPLIRDVAARCRPKPPAEWAREIHDWMDEISAPRGELDRLALTADYAAVEPALCLRVARRELAGSQLARDAGGGLATFPVISVGGRYRRVTHAMLERWRVDADRCQHDAAVRTARAQDIIDEPMFSDQPSVRQVYGRDLEREASRRLPTPALPRDPSGLCRVDHPWQPGPLRSPGRSGRDRPHPRVCPHHFGDFRGGRQGRRRAQLVARVADARRATFRLVRYDEAAAAT